MEVRLSGYLIRDDKHINCTWCLVMACLQIIFCTLCWYSDWHTWSVNFRNLKSRCWFIAHVPRSRHTYTSEVGLCVMADGVRQLFSVNCQMCYKWQKFCDRRAICLEIKCGTRIGLCTPSMKTRERYRNEDRLIGLYCIETVKMNRLSSFN